MHMELKHRFACRSSFVWKRCRTRSNTLFCVSKTAAESELMDVTVQSGTFGMNIVTSVTSFLKIFEAL